MSTQFTVLSTYDFPDGTVVLAGSVVGPLLTPGRRGHTTTASGEIEIEVLSICINNSWIYDANTQNVQVKITKGDERSLKGAIINFD